jgi:transcriptional regulator with XRE-family HTH domain
MELGQRLKQARLASGLSQRQLCGDVITRNMLSQIENGSARPSMDTLRYLASRLEKPMGYFLEDQAVLSPNLQVMEQARCSKGQAVLDALADYQGPDQFDYERYLLEALACLELAQTALDAGKKGLAATLLERAGQAGQKSPYYTGELETRRLLLSYEAGAVKPEQVPVDMPMLLIQAQAKLELGKPTACIGILEAIEERNSRWHYLQAEALFAMQNYRQAAEHYLLAEDYAPGKVYGRLEHCYRELEDFKQAYFYACKQR